VTVPDGLADWRNGQEIFEAVGEFLSMPERMVVSPVWGRFHREPVEEGTGLAESAPIARVTEHGGVDTILVVPVASVFVAWLAFEGERVWPGMPIARVRPMEV
jgi:hypothetical protein